MEDILQDCRDNRIRFWGLPVSRGAVWANGMLGIMKLVLACGIYEGRNTEMRAEQT